MNVQRTLFLNVTGMAGIVPDEKVECIRDEFHLVDALRLN